MSNLVRAAIVSALSFCCATASAVVLNPRGTGQVLIYPYYTVNAGNGTLLSVVNTTQRGKALKLRFLEGYNGREVQSFNLYLSPFDVWVAQVFDASGNGTGSAAVATYDKSCTNLAFADFPEFPPQAFDSLYFDDSGYTGANADGGPSGLERTREGYVEVIEMGEVTNATHNTLDAITHTNSGAAANCGQVVDAWQGGGYWTIDPTIDLAPPTGGLYGSESIINVSQGTLYAVNPEVIDGFSSTIQHTNTGNAAPDLNTATKSADGTLTASVPIGGKSIEAVYTNSEDAISSLLMADALFNEYVIDVNVGASSDWVVTLPTKRFYTDPALLPPGTSQARHPFDEVFSTTHAGASCSPAPIQFWNREELTTTSSECAFGGICPTLPPVGLCFTTNVITIGSPESIFDSKALYMTPSGGFIDPTSVAFTAGHMQLDMVHDWTWGLQLSHELASANGRTLHGLPAMGFAATNYVNANVTAGVLANYSGAYPHRNHASCSASSTPPNTSCP